MKEFVSKQETLIEANHINQAEVYPPFPILLTEVKVDIPDEVLLAQTTHQNSEVDVVWDTNRQVLRQLQSDEDADYFMKPSIFGSSANILSFSAVNEHLLMSFAKLELAFGVLSNALVPAATGGEYHLLIKKN